jgi:hypothetical protein
MQRFLARAFLTYAGAEERSALEALARPCKTSQALALRTRIVLACADGRSVTAVAADLGGHAEPGAEMAVSFSGG